jgi:hypothetical protein
MDLRLSRLRTVLVASLLAATTSSGCSSGSQQTRSDLDQNLVGTWVESGGQRIYRLLPDGTFDITLDASRCEKEDAIKTVQGSWSESSNLLVLKATRSSSKILQHSEMHEEIVRVDPAALELRSAVGVCPATDTPPWTVRFSKK